MPFAREYMLSKCAGREAEGRVTSVVSFLIAANRLALQLLRPSAAGLDTASGVALSLLVLEMMLELILLIYSIRVYAGLIEVYGVRRRWLWLWVLLAGLPATIWGLSDKYQPLWKVEDIRKELASIASTGTAEVLTDGLTVNLRVRTVREGFEKKILLRDVHLSIPRGHMVLLLGGSGAGKTVFLNAISGYEKADASVLLGGEDLYRQYKKLQYQVGYAPQQDTMRGKDTIYSTLLDTARLRLPILPLDVLHNGPVRIRTDHIALHLRLLPKSPASADCLVEGLEAVRQADEYHVMARLEVHAESGNRRFRDEDAQIPGRKVI